MERERWRGRGRQREVVTDGERARARAVTNLATLKSTARGSLQPTLSDKKSHFHVFTDLGFVQAGSEPVRLGRGEAGAAGRSLARNSLGKTSTELSLDGGTLLPVRTSPPNSVLPKVLALPARASKPRPCVEALSPLLGTLPPKSAELKLPVLASLGLSTSCAPERISRASCPASL